MTSSKKRKRQDADAPDNIVRPETPQNAKKETKANHNVSKFASVAQDKPGTAQVPEVAAPNGNVQEGNNGANLRPKKQKKAKKSRKEPLMPIKGAQDELVAARETKSAQQNGDAHSPLGSEPVIGCDKTALKESTTSKKTKKAKTRRSNPISVIQPRVESTPTFQYSKSDKETEDAQQDQIAASVSATPATKPSRFIVFIGNLPYSTTTPQLTTHFAAIRPTSIRHLTKPGTTKSKGFAFLEFDGYDRMKTCLKLYHHSEFEGRRINVELTAGGGGKSRGRMDKVKAKNAKLEEERHRRAKEAAKDQGKKKGGVSGKATGKGKEMSAEVVSMDQSDIHPSRRAQVKAVQ